MSSLKHQKVCKKLFIIKGGIEVNKCFLGQVWTWENYTLGYMSQSYRWTSIKFIENVEYRSKGDGGKREVQGEGGSRQKGGKRKRVFPDL